LTNASTTGSTNYPAWGLSETYDLYGNRSIQGTSSGCTGITCPTNSVTINAATNRISGSPYAYDLGGNMTNDGQNTIVYDGENRAVSATVTGSSSGTYTYDGNSLRVQKVSVVSGTTITTAYIISGSKVIAEYDNGALPAAPTREYVYAGTALLAKIDTSGTKYYHQDHLSNRLVTDSSGNTVTQIGHFPFGESWYNASNDKLVFTSYERDAESGNDYAKARYYISRLARFSSPDPVTGNPLNPQSWNRYTYVQNDPINLSDPQGKYCQWEDGTSDDPPEQGGGGASRDECTSQGGKWVPDAPDAQPADETVTVTADPIDDVIQLNATIEQTLLVPRNTVGALYPRAAILALQLALDPDCAKFLKKIGQSATLAAANMQAGAPFLPNAAGRLVQSTYDNYTGLQVAQLAFSSTADVQGVDKREGKFTTFAAATGNTDNPQITLYRAFTIAVLKLQAQVLLHEGTHELALYASDQQLAAAAGVPGAAQMDISHASDAFTTELEKHCKP